LFYNVPLKVSLFAWRLLRNRLPSKDNLAQHRVIYIDDIVCVAACGAIETPDHLLSTVTFLVPCGRWSCNGYGYRSLLL